MNRIFKVLIVVLILSIFSTQASAVYLNETVCIDIGGHWSEISTGHKTCRSFETIYLERNLSLRNTINEIDLEIADSELTINPGVIINLEQGGRIIVGHNDMGGTLNNNGHINIRDGGFFGSYSGSVHNYGIITNYGRFFNHVTFRNNGEIHNSATFVNEDTIEEGIIINSGTINNRPFGILKNSGIIDNRPGGTVNNEMSGPVKKLGLFYKGIRGGTINNKLTINNHGTINNNWIVNNEIGGTIDNTADGNINNRRTINNRGTIYNCGIITGHPIQYNPFIVPVKCFEFNE